MASSLRIGAAWYKRDKNGNEYLSLSISTPCPVILQPDQRLSLFPNPNKQTDNQPDFDLVILPDAARGAAPQAGQQFEQDDFSPNQQARQDYGQGRSQAPEDVRPAPPRQPTRQPAGTPAPRATRQPAPPPDLDEELEDPFAEDDEPLLAPAPRGTRPPARR